MTHKYTNALINETSSYLLQHAHNPVNWEAWNPEVLERAKKENKLKAKTETEVIQII